jgi:phage tail-like protein
MPSQASALQVVSAAHFVIKVENQEVASFSELSGINSEIEAVEYISASEAGGTTHSKQFGKIKPPKVTLKRGLDNSNYIWLWHQAALLGDPLAIKTEVALQLISSGGGIQVTYLLEDAWPSKVDIAGAKAGASDVIMETVEIVCSQILMPS